MANLVTVTKESRLLLKVGGILFGLFFVAYMIFSGGAFLSNLFFPKPPPPPEQKLGKLPHIIFPEQKGNIIGLEYRINTLDGNLPNLPDRIDVYKLIPSEPNLLALQSAKNTLDSKNFIENQFKITDTLYRWTQTKTGIVIEYDIVSNNFTLMSNFLTNPSLSSSDLMPSEDAIKNDTISYLQTIKANTQNIDLEKTKIEYLELQNGLLVAAQNLGTARYARVTLNQKSVGEIPIIYDAPGNSLLTFVASYPETGFQLLEGQFFNHQIDEENKSDYSIKTSQQAFEDLKNGKAYVLNPLNLTNIDITNVELKYYLSKINQGFMLPVIVFTGINFTAYVEALPDTSLEN